MPFYSICNIKKFQLKLVLLNILLISKIMIIPMIMITIIAKPALAVQWVIENPKLALPENLVVVNKYDFGTNHFLVVRDQSDMKLSSEELLNIYPGLNEQILNAIAFQIKILTDAQSAVPDMMIELPDFEKPNLNPNGDGDDQLTIPTDTPAWHVEQLRYNELPSEFDGRNVLIGLIDTGVDIKHTSIHNHLFKNPGEIENNAIDDDKNGYIDDAYGYNFFKGTGSAIDESGHGTHCAGLIVADPRNPNIQFSPQGLARGAKILPMKIIGSNGKGFLSNAAAAIKYSVDNGAKVLSNSWRIYRNWGEYFDEEGLNLLKTAIQYAEQKGVLFLAASGNEGINLDSEEARDPEKNPTFPIQLSDVHIAVVAASNQNHDLAKFSNYGVTKVHVAAPGDNIISTIILGNDWGEMSGTSMATPIVAASIARGISQGFSPVQAFELLQSTSEKNNSYQDKIKSGLINLVEYHKKLGEMNHESNTKTQRR